MHLASETVHRIIATAFHGDQPSNKHVVDHIDTNRQNNRPENLRWITRLENLLLNPITLKRIIYNYGSIENFFDNPSNPMKGTLEPNFDWMRTVTQEESESTRKTLLNWAKHGKVPTGRELGEWIFNQSRGNKEVPNDEVNYTQSITSNAIQIKWKTPTEFPNCPKSIDDNSLKKYKNNLNKGGVFGKNMFGDSVVVDFEISDTSKELYVVTRSQNIKPFALAKVYIEGEVFVHESMGSFFKLNGSLKQINLSLGREWTGGDTIDDFS